MAARKKKPPTTRKKNRELRGAYASIAVLALRNDVNEALVCGKVKRRQHALNNWLMLIQCWKKMVSISLFCGDIPYLLSFPFLKGVCQTFVTLENISSLNEVMLQAVQLSLQNNPLCWLAKRLIIYCLLLLLLNANLLHRPNMSWYYYHDTHRSRTFGRFRKENG